ncbi:hemolysin [Bradyrhizobium sp. 31Argb]|uniref:hemolysin n=1 Tax=Bradyrhizobium sp. 31Argb TaxID=3141247 RepID=UPI003748EAAC
MTSTINLTSASSDLLGYLTGAWENDFNYNDNGAFYPTSSPYSEWAAGNSGVSGDSGVILHGSGFTYSPPGGFSGTITELDFGHGLTGSSSSGFGLTTPELSIELGGSGGTSPDTTFNQAIYVLSHGGSVYGQTEFGQPFAGLVDYLGETGTTQNGTSGDDYLYSFYGNDALSGNGGSSDFDTFKWDHSLYDSSHGFGNDTISDFVQGNDLIDFKNYGWSDYSQFISDSHVNVAGNTITYTDPTNASLHSTVTVDGVSSLSASDFAFV